MNKTVTQSNEHTFVGMDENLYEVKLFHGFVSTLSRIFQTSVPRRSSEAHSQRPAGGEAIPTDKWTQIQCKHSLL